MTQEEISKLQTELESLRQENRRLRAVTHLQVNGSGKPRSEDGSGQDDHLLPTFQQQLERVKQANEQLRQSMMEYSELEKSLETLIPALEVQIKGWTNEVRYLKESNQDTENTYASVVERLESRIQDLKAQTAGLKSADYWEDKLQALQQKNQQLQEQVIELKAVCDAYEAQEQAPTSEAELADPPTSEGKSNPFTSLNIFDL